MIVKFSKNNYKKKKIMKRFKDIKNNYVIIKRKNNYLNLVIYIIVI